MQPKRFGMPVRACEICSREARHVCRSCNKSVCDMHYSVQMGVCSMCAARRNREQMQGQDMKARTSDMCAVCPNQAKHVCRSCNKSVCDRHFDQQMNICVMCKIKKEREEMRAGP